MECTPGTFYDNETQTCPKCERGYYQDQSGQMSCEQCQNNTITRSVYSKNITDCIGKVYLLQHAVKLIACIIIFLNF